MKILIGLILLTLLTVYLSANAEGAPPVDVLSSAHILGNSLVSQGFVYPQKGLPAGTKTIDCTQFVQQLVEQLIPNLPLSVQKRIAMSDLDGGEVSSNKNNIITGKDFKTKGVQQALVDIHRGDVVTLDSAQPGDLIQYWMRQSSGLWFGHAGVVERIEGNGTNKRAWLYGSHASKVGIGIAPDVGLRLIESDDRHIYIVRLK